MNYLRATPCLRTTTAAHADETSTTAFVPHLRTDKEGEWEPEDDFNEPPAPKRGPNPNDDH